MTAIVDAFAAEFGPGRVAARVPLAPFTTFRVGGPAEWLIETRTSDEIVRALTTAARLHLPVTLLGGGSNVLVADSGVRGLVVRPRGGVVERDGDALVRADAAVTINGLVRWTVLHGAAGLEAWAGTPGTVGGAIFGNAHFSGRSIGELVEHAGIATREGVVSNVSGSALAFACRDRSRLQTTGEVLLWAAFRVSAGEPDRLRATARESLAFRKRTQPLETPSAGCIFQNPQQGTDAVPPGIPWSAGALIDRAGLKGVSIGGARVSPTHGNFIVNDGAASADDIHRLVERCRDEVRRQFGVELRDEIVRLGNFD